MQRPEFVKAHTEAAGRGSERDSFRIAAN